MFEAIQQKMEIFQYSQSLPVPGGQSESASDLQTFR